ncbi:hypothetical protein O998_01695 [Anaplasma phagocytophilum str. Norway variant1]|uniref:Uncharacterized protein n=2 Tax=Anaplasma phagocytophilum TaxID=948 RepID=A0A7H9DYC5_ANAPH|nr:hypothetical protein O998_01695 [Anaplasma phagocytophilum str. Norway variant1]
MCRGVTLPRCYTIHVLCCVNDTIWNLEVLSTERICSAETCKHLDRGYIADAAAGDDSGNNVAGVRSLIKVIFS